MYDMENVGAVHLEKKSLNKFIKPENLKAKPLRFKFLSMIV